MFPLWTLFLLLSVTEAFATITSNESLLWGPYRPNLYFGLRPKLPNSLMTGLMWFGANDYQSINKIRHACDQEDELDSYSWTHFDARRGGVQVLKDRKNNIQITTEFLKVPGGNYGGSWATRIRGELMSSDPSRTSVLFYLGLEGLGELKMDDQRNKDDFLFDISFLGSSPGLGEFTIRFVDSHANTTHYLGRALPAGSIWRAEEIVLKSIVEHANELIRLSKDQHNDLPDPSLGLRLPDYVETSSNLFVVQKLFQGNFQLDIFFESGNTRRALNSATLDQGIPALISAIDARFKTTLPVPPSYPDFETQALEFFSKSITSNLLGGIGYFHGPSIISRRSSYEWDNDGVDSEDNDITLTEQSPVFTHAQSLFTATPSRSFFPRGFYWDEGFHIMHISRWDVDLSLDILKSWIDLIDDDGWVAREQILGDEARSKVPEEFQAQVPQFANPPTLIMAITTLIARIESSHIGVVNGSVAIEASAKPLLVPLSKANSNAPTPTPLYDIEDHYLQSPDCFRAFLKTIYGSLKRHYYWFRRTQRGQIKQYSRVAHSRIEAYRWRGRSELHVLTSGMDDYPRGPPHFGELHLDLICWMGYFTKAMVNLARFVGETEDELLFREIEISILNNIEGDLHWNEEQQMYCDSSINQEDESLHICHKGYLSIFPFLLTLLPPSSPRLAAILDLLNDPQHLWSPYGLRSLSASHSEYGQGENYWKGPIWVQMNYLALRALHQTYAAQEGPYQERAKKIYIDLRQQIINNVFKQFQRTGYVWEQYDSYNGEGKRSHPFTGWTSLVSLILSEKY